MMGMMVFRKGEGDGQGEGNVEQRGDKGPDVAVAVPQH